MSNEYKELIDRAETAPDSTGVIPIYTSDPQPTIAGTAADLPGIQS